MAIVNKPSDYFNTVLYTGNGGTDHAITGVGFQPDFCWFKNRTGVNWHNLFDVVRGVTKSLASNTTDIEETRANGLTVFGTDGFTLGGNDGNVNTSGQSYASWNWKAGGTAVSNTAGSITSSVSANTDSGFSVVTYTGTGSSATIGHGLTSPPKMVIVKSRSGAGEWITWHTGINIQAKLSLNTTDAIYNPGTGLYWNSTLPTSSVFSVGTTGSLNGSSVTYVAYCFANTSMIKCGSYTGNGSADGTFVFTGMKPAFVLIKQTNTSNIWELFDNKRSPSNLVDDYLSPDSSDAETVGSSQSLDFLSNGFKPKANASGLNSSGGSYIYLAIAEQPFVTSTANGSIPATAR